MRLLKCGLATAGLCALAPFACADQGQDLLVGNGTPGPFFLSWKQIQANTESVQIDQQTQTRGLDYTLDPDAGTITFVHALPSQAAASVRYQYDPAHAIAGPSTKIPLAFDLARGNNSQVSFNALYQVSPQTFGVTAAQSLTLGVGSGWQGQKGQIATHFLFAPALANADHTQSGNDLSRLGVTADAKLEATRGVQLSFGYTQAGEKMSTAADNGLTAGRQTLAVGTDLTPSQKVHASINWAQSDPAVAHAGSTTTHTTAAFSVTPSSSVEIQSHWTETGGADTVPSQTADISLSAAPSAITKVNASFATVDSAGQVADSQALNLAASLAPTQTVAVNAGIGQTRDASGLVNQQQVSVALTPRSTINLQTSLALRQDDAAQSRTAFVGGRLQPLSFLQIAAGYKDRVASFSDPQTPDLLDTSTASLTLTPFEGFRLIGSYAQNPDNGGDTPQRLAQRGVGLETTLGMMHLSGGYDWQRQYDLSSVGTTMHIGVGLRLSQATQIDGSYKQTLCGLGDAASGVSLYGLGINHNLGDRFHLSLEGTMQKPTGPAVTASPDYTANASLGMKF